MCKVKNTENNRFIYFNFIYFLNVRSIFFEKAVYWENSKNVNYQFN